ncbi:MAG: hypothetical protein R3C59_23165 [Planctomycetaceae bacterium]
MPEFLTSGFVASTNTKDFEVLYAGYRFETATTLFHVRHRVLNVAIGCWVQEINWVCRWDQHMPHTS